MYSTVLYFSLTHSQQRITVLIGHNSYTVLPNNPEGKKKPGTHFY